MQDPHRHIMQLETRHASGAEEWSCPTCGRRFLLEWPPKYKKTILEPGDEAAFHSGSKGSLSNMLSIDMSQGADLAPADSAADRPSTYYSDFIALDDTKTTPHPEELGPWLKWLATANLDDYLDQAL
jgi:hypothetical protein